MSHIRKINDEMTEEANNTLQKYVANEYITYRQAQAIHYMVADHMTQSEVAEEIGMVRETISKWNSRNENFQEVKREYQNVLRKQAISKSLDVAVNDLLREVVMEAYEEGDTDKAIEALKAVGVYGEALDLERMFNEEMHAKDEKEKALLEGYRSLKENPYAAAGLHGILAQVDEDVLYNVGKELKSIQDPVIEIEVK